MTGSGESYEGRDKDGEDRGKGKDGRAQATGGEGFAAGAPASELSYSEASRELDSIVEFFERRDVDVDQLVARLERATAIVEELDRRIRRTSAQVEELVPRLDAVSRGTQHDEGWNETPQPVQRAESTSDVGDDIVGWKSDDDEAEAEEDPEEELEVWDGEGDTGMEPGSMPEQDPPRGQLPF
jgi:exodeoxyribonuclease VII small subunit